jgi:hypothetical protein
MAFSPLMDSAQVERALILLDRAWSQVHGASQQGAEDRDKARLSYIVESVLTAGGGDDTELVRRIVQRFRTLSQRFPDHPMR